MNNYTHEEIIVNPDEEIAVHPDEFLKSLPENISVTLNKAQAQLHTLPRQNVPTLDTWKVLRLGKPPGEKEKDALPALADILAAGQKPFCVGFRGSSKGNAAYFLGIEEDPKGTRAQGLLQAAFGLAQVESLKARDYRFKKWGVCKRVYFNEDQLNQLPKVSDITTNWVDSLACTIFNKDCEVLLSFCPLDPKWLEQELQSTSALLDELTKYQESSLQISKSGGVTINTTGNIGERLAECFTSSKKESGSENTSTSVNLKQEHWAVMLACEELQFRIRELKQLKRDSSWSLCIQARAHWSPDLQIMEQILGSLFIQAGYLCSWQQTNQGTGMLLPGSQAVRFVHSPSSTFPGLELEQLHNFEANLPQPEGPALKAGYLMWNGMEMKVSDPTAGSENQQPTVLIPLKDLNSHGFICGKSGSGKTNSVCSLLSCLDGIPFMVIEPVKGEYRSLQSIMPELKIFNLEIHGKNQLHMNPFWFPKYGKLNYHIDSLKSIIAASFELEAAMPDILEQCLVSSYVKKGWNISTNQNVFAGKLPDEMLYPTFSTLCNEVERYLEDAAFGPELKSNYKGALLSRLQSYTTGTKGLLLNCPSHPPFEDWIRNKTSCVIELDELADDSDKAIIMGTLLTQYFQCIKYGSSHIKPELQHVIVLEEAHHLFKDTGASGGGRNNRQQLVELLSNLLAEIRAYGEGILIVDQSPTTVSPQVIKNTAVKLVHYTDYVDDLKVLRECLLLDGDDESAPASLKRGHALLRFSSMLRPVHVRMPLCETKENMGIHKETHCASDDAQNILDMIRMNRTSRDKLQGRCRMFVNHFLFDTPIKKYEALHILKEDVLSEAVSFGYDQDTLAGLSADGLEYILRNLIVESLPGKYPNQYLLCGRLQMVVERYLALCLLQTESISEHQNLMIEQYLRLEIQPALSYYYKNSTNPQLRQITGAIPPSHFQMVCLSEILLNMNHALELAQQEEKKRDRIYDIDKIFAKPAEIAVLAMGSKDFLLPTDQNLSKELWLLFQVCWKDAHRI